MKEEHPELPGNPNERWQLKARLDLALENRDRAVDAWMRAEAELIGALHSSDPSHVPALRESARQAEEQIRQHTHDEFAIRNQWHALDMKELSAQANSTADGLKAATWGLFLATCVLAAVTFALIFATLNA